MKLLIILAILASCGKHSMPAEKDFRDSDGDQIVNELDSDMHVANVIPLNILEAELSFQTGLSSLKPHSLVLTNKFDLENLSRDLMVKNVAAIKMNGYFQEYSLLRLKTVEKNIQLDSPTISLKLTFLSQVETANRISYIEQDQKTDLGQLSPVMEFTLTAEKLKKILSGEAFLSINNLAERAKFQIHTQEDSIKEKSYRVLFNNGKQTAVYYISKEVSFEQILTKFKISRYKMIEDENLLTTTLKTTESEWYVRNIGNQDIIIIKNNLRSLSDHYFKGFHKTVVKISRENGIQVNSVKLNKHPSARVLLKIRGNKNLVSWGIVRKETGHIIGGQNHENSRCILQVREGIDPVSQIISNDEVANEISYAKELAALQVQKIHMRGLIDEKGHFLEIDLHDQTEVVEFGLRNIAQDQYVVEDVIHSKCGPDAPKPRKPVPLRMSVPERSMNLEIEAFVEKI